VRLARAAPADRGVLVATVCVANESTAAPQDPQIRPATSLPQVLQ
jgi:hypothetical protein